MTPYILFLLVRYISVIFGQYMFLLIGVFLIPDFISTLGLCVTSYPFTGSAVFLICELPRPRSSIRSVPQLGVPCHSFSLPFLCMAFSYRLFRHGTTCFFPASLAAGLTALYFSRLSRLLYRLFERPSFVRPVAP